MFSMPPATAVSTDPTRISCAADTIACAPEPHTRFTVKAGTVTGRPACTAAWVHLRAGLNNLPHDRGANLVRFESGVFDGGPDRHRAEIGRGDVLKAAVEG